MAKKYTNKFEIVFESENKEVYIDIAPRIRKFMLKIKSIEWIGIPSIKVEEKK